MYFQILTKHIFDEYIPVSHTIFLDDNNYIEEDGAVCKLVTDTHFRINPSDKIYYNNEQIFDILDVVSNERNKEVYLKK